MSHWQWLTKKRTEIDWTTPRVSNLYSVHCKLIRQRNAKAFVQVMEIFFILFSFNSQKKNPNHVNLTNPPKLPNDKPRVLSQRSETLFPSTCLSILFLSLLHENHNNNMHFYLVYFFAINFIFPFHVLYKKTAQTQTLVQRLQCVMNW